MKHLLDMTPDEVAAELKSFGLPAFRARQVAEWVWAKGVVDFSGMTNLPAGLRKQLAERLTVFSGRAVRRTDADDGVVKLLLEWPDGERIETVMIPSPPRRTACVSTQVGCAVGCSFCATGGDGFTRNLSAGEIVEQVLQLRAACGERISHVVFMGMGEPLANYDATLSAVRALIDSERGGLSARHITISTIGLPHQMQRLALEDIPLTLAISLHAPNNALRRKLIPGAKNVSIEQIIDAGREFFASRGRELTLEYVLLAGVNDTSACAEELVAIARQLRCNVNLIRFNPVAGLAFERPGERQVQGFAERLTAAGVNVQVRRGRGGQADAACGQLRRRDDAP